MQYTNRFNLPEPAVKLITEDTYDKGESDYSITELISPPRKAEILRRHGHEIVVDVSEELYRLYGRLIHELLEQGGVPERRWAMTIHEKVVSGKPDRFQKAILEDWKFTTAWRFKGNTVPEDFVQQLNGYTELLRENNGIVREQFAHGFLRDWSKLEMFRNRDYPRQQYVKVPIPMWGRAQSGLFLRNRVILHEKARFELPLCTKEERWAKDDEYAVIRKGKKRATRVFSTQEIAEQYITELKKPHLYNVVFREGESIRCKAYCHAISFCTQGQEILKKEKLKKENEGMEEVKTVVSTGNPKASELHELLDNLIERLNQGGAIEVKLQGVELRFEEPAQGGQGKQPSREPAPTCKECGEEKIPSKRGTGYYCVVCWKKWKDEQ